MCMYVCTYMYIYMYIHIHLLSYFFLFNKLFIDIVLSVAPHTLDMFDMFRCFCLKDMLRNCWLKLYVDFFPCVCMNDRC